MSIGVIFVLFLFSCLGFDTVFVPSSFATVVPLIFTSSIQDFATKIDLCVEGVTQYDGCEVIATANTPFDKWSYNDGVFVSFRMTRDNDGCEEVLCRNSPRNFTNFNVCRFIYRHTMGHVLYAQGNTSRGVSSLTVTFNVKIACSGKIPLSRMPSSALSKNYKVNPVRQSLCPAPEKITPSKTTVADIGLPAVLIPTSRRYADAAKFVFIACPNQGQFSDLVISVQAMTEVSAFSSYVCDSQECTVNDAKGPKWMDTSASSFNLIRPAEPVEAQVLYLTVYGWGFEGKDNSFTFDILLSNWGM